MRENYYIEENVKLGNNVKIGIGTIIKKNTTIGDNSEIGPYCIIGENNGISNEELFIGPNSNIRSHSIIYSGSKFKSELITGHHVLIREKTIVGKNMVLGSFSDVEGQLEIGNYCRFHSYVHLGIGSKIGNYVKIYSLVTLTNDPLPPSHLVAPVTIEDGVVISVGSTILPGSLLKLGAFVSANSIVNGEVPIGAVIKGSSSEVVGKVNSLINFEKMVRHPWMNHYFDAYPESEHENISLLKSKILKGIKRNADH